MFTFLKPLFTIAVPIILQNFLSSFVNMLDTIMVGQLGSVEIAAVGLGNQIFFLMNMVLFGTVSGGSIFISQYWGKKDMDGVHRTLGITIILSAIISVLFFLLAFFEPEMCLRFYSEDEELISIGVDYLKTVSFSYLFIGLGFPFAHAERSTERVKLPMIATFVSVIVNCVLNYLLIFGVSFGGTEYVPAMGVVGAAVATVVSRIIEFILLLVVPYIKKYEMAASPSRLFRRQPGFMSQYVKICLPVLLNETLWGLGTTMQNVIYGHAGTDMVAAINITSTIGNLIWTFFIGTGNATGILLGKTIGEGKHDEARSLAKKYTFFNAGAGLVLGLLLIPLSLVLPYVFNVESEVMHMAVTMVYLSMALYPFSASNMTMVVGVCRSGGDTIYALLMDVGFLWILAIPLGFAGVYAWHLPYWALYLCIRSDEVFKCTMGIVRLLSGKWLNDVTTTMS
ncbi:MAG: MATE family efflux transporter [Treponema sp.]|nr:MATE family efflux transporter [Candidatus Treponema caballi]